MNKSDRSDRSARAVMIAAFIGFIISGVAYVAAPPRTTAQFFDSSTPAILWGVVFFVGGMIAVNGVIRKVPHIERLGLMLVIIAGTVLTLTQGAVMFADPITWSRGGGTGVYGSFTILSIAFWLRLGRNVETVNLVADLQAEREADDGS